MAHNIKPTAKQIRSKKIDRSSQIKRDDKSKMYEVGLYDIDASIKYYIDNVIQPKVKNANNSIVQLPVIYGSAEKWKSVQKSNFYRDSKGKIQLPIMMYKKTRIDKLKDFSSKVDPNSPIAHYIKMGYSKSNKYDNFSRLYGRKPVESFHRVIIPDYVTVSYDCIIWTEMISQMNSLIEAINYSEGAYWGEPNKFNFKSKIDSYNPATEISSGKDRATRCTFNLELQGFIIPNTIQKQLNNSQTKTLSTARLQIGSEKVVSDINNLGSHGNNER